MFVIMTILIQHPRKISITYYMDYLGYFGYEQSTDLFFREVGSFDNELQNFKIYFYFLILLLNFNIAYSKIIFDKNDIIITEIEVQEYIKFIKIILVKN